MATPSNFVISYLFGLSLFLSNIPEINSKYLPTWESLDSRPLPAWYDEAKLGIFIHWGVFSVPSFRSEWFWWDWQGAKYNDTVEFMKKNYKPDFTYPDFAKQFTAEFFVASEWVKIFQESGAKYIVFVSKHHEGYTNWPSKYSFNWNSKAVGPGRDIVGELAQATKAANIHFGLYHSLFEWFNPIYLKDKASNFTTQDFVFDKTLAELYELVNTYNPDVVWSDGDWEASDNYWQSKEFLAWLYNESPVKDSVVTNDRWGQGVMCHHGGYFTCQDRYNPHHLLAHKWENAMTIDKQSWGFRRNAKFSDYLSIEELLEELVTTVSCNGNVLLNVGPTHDGVITPIYQERLAQLGSWLKVNGEGIYSSRPWTYQNDTETPGVWYTSKTISSQKVVYAFMLSWPEDSQVYLAAPTALTTTEVTMLGLSGAKLAWKGHTPQGITITLPLLNVAQLPCQWVWTLRLTQIQN